MMDSVNFCGLTDLGCVRTNNEDAFVVQKVWDENHILAVAIDGVGGYEGGEIASALARDSIVEFLAQYPNGERLDLLKQAVVYANNTIFTQRKEQPQYAQMSCVLTAILVELKERRINMAHVGDTRLYEFSEEGIVKLSHDHSLVGYREEIGQLSELEAMHHPQRNLISRDVGSKYIDDSSDDVEVAVFPLKSHSMLLLCSDGLTDMITSAQICDVLSEEVSVEQRAQNLIDAAKKAGGRDNVTVVLVDVQLAEMEQVCEEQSEQRAEEECAEEECAGEESATTQDEEVKPRCRCCKIGLWPIVLALAVGYLLGGYTGGWLRGKSTTAVAVEVPDSINVVDTLNGGEENSLEKEPNEDQAQSEDTVQTEPLVGAEA